MLPSSRAPLIVIVGPTASGKSDLAMSIAETFNGEIVNYDSVQIYRRLDIGSAKPSREDRARVPHHMIDIREPAEQFSAGDYQREGRLAVADIQRRGRIPILAGGTGLYLRALLEGLFAGPSRSDHWRTRLEHISEEKGREHLHRLLTRLDPQAAARIAPRDKPKIIRALEVRLETGRELSSYFKEEPRRPLEGVEVLTVGLNPPREECYRRIDQRVLQMMERGFVDEVRGLLNSGVPPDAWALHSIGYRHIVANVESCNAWDDTIRIIQRDTRRYAKRQMTWFRKNKMVRWFDGFGNDPLILSDVIQAIRLTLPQL